MSEAQETFYQTLGLQSYASIDEVRTAYRKLVARFHPDWNPDPAAEPVFRSITAAYRTLSDMTRKSVYDATLRQLPPTEVHAPLSNDDGAADQDEGARQTPATLNASPEQPPDREGPDVSLRLRAIADALSVSDAKPQQLPSTEVRAPLSNDDEAVDQDEGARRTPATLNALPEQPPDRKGPDLSLRLRAIADAISDSDAKPRQLPSTEVHAPLPNDDKRSNRGNAARRRRPVFEEPPERLLDLDSPGWSLKLRAIVALIVVTLLGGGALTYMYWPYLQSVRAPGVGQTFADCSACPSMVVVPAGSFTMGSREDNAPGWALPAHQVTIAAPFAIGRSEVTFQQFVEFLNDNVRNLDTRWIITDQIDSNSRVLTRLGKYVVQSGYDNHPAIGVSWLGATAYAQWLADKTRRKYRLPSEAEWEYAARAGTESKYYSGSDARTLCEIGNVPDLARQKVHRNSTVYLCEDGFVETAPIARFRPNAFGLYDTLGNAWEWVQDCWHPTYEGAPSDGTVWTGGDCQSRILRGNGFSSFFGAGIAARAVDRMYRMSDVNGFRIVRALD